MKTNYTEEQKHELVKRYYDGESVSTICLQTGVPRSTFYTWVKPYKVVGAVLACEVSAANYTQQKKRIDKLESMIKVLQAVNCTVASPLQIKLKELTKLYGQYSVHTLCDSLKVPRGTFYNHILRNKKDNTSYRKRREELSILVKDIFEENHQIYGANKIHAILKSRGIRTSTRMVSELMQFMGLSSTRNHTKRQYAKQLRKSKKDMLKMNFSTNAPNQVWVSDITYFRLNNDTRYICVIMDLFSRKVIAYKVSQKQSTQLVTSTFKQAYHIRQPKTNITFHSDRGSQYTSYTLRKLFITLNVTQSFSPSNSPYHNAVMESFFSNLKKEQLYRIDYHSIKEFNLSVDDYIDKYNNERPHSTLQYKTPNAFEKAFYRKKDKQ
jgi:putative transposase